MRCRLACHSRCSRASVDKVATKVDAKQLAAALSVPDVSPDAWSPSQVGNQLESLVSIAQDEAVNL
jgi:hypothetical protein